MRKNFKVGSPAMWAQHQKNYKPKSYSGKKNLQDPNMVLKNTKSPMINVKKRGH